MYCQKYHSVFAIEMHTTLVGSVDVPLLGFCLNCPIEMDCLVTPCTWCDIATLLLSVHESSGVINPILSNH